MNRIIKIVFFLTLGLNFFACNHDDPPSTPAQGPVQEYKFDKDLVLKSLTVPCETKWNNLKSFLKSNATLTYRFKYSDPLYTQQSDDFTADIELGSQTQDQIPISTVDDKFYANSVVGTTIAPIMPTFEIVPNDPIKKDTFLESCNEFNVAIKDYINNPERINQLLDEEYQESPKLTLYTTESQISGIKAPVLILELSIKATTDTPYVAAIRSYVRLDNLFVVKATETLNLTANNTPISNGVLELLSIK